MTNSGLRLLSIQPWHNIQSLATCCRFVSSQVMRCWSIGIPGRSAARRLFCGHSGPRHGRFDREAPPLHPPDDAELHSLPRHCEAHRAHFAAVLRRIDARDAALGHDVAWIDLLLFASDLGVPGLHRYARKDELHAEAWKDHDKARAAAVLRAPAIGHGVTLRGNYLALVRALLPALQDAGSFEGFLGGRGARKLVVSLQMFAKAAGREGVEDPELRDAVNALLRLRGRQQRHLAATGLSPAGAIQ